MPAQPEWHTCGRCGTAALALSVGETVCFLGSKISRNHRPSHPTANKYRNAKSWAKRIEEHRSAYDPARPNEEYQ